METTLGVTDHSMHIRVFVHIVCILLETQHTHRHHVETML